MITCSDFIIFVEDLQITACTMQTFIFTATLSSNSCKSTIVFDTFYFRSAETVRRKRYVS